MQLSWRHNHWDIYCQKEDLFHTSLYICTLTDSYWHSFPYNISPSTAISTITDTTTSMWLTWLSIWLSSLSKKTWVHTWLLVGLPIAINMVINNLPYDIPTYMTDITAEDRFKPGYWKGIDSYQHGKLQLAIWHYYLHDWHHSRRQVQSWLLVGLSIATNMVINILPYDITTYMTDITTGDRFKPGYW